MATERDAMTNRWPVAAARAKTSRPTAVRLHCVECMGGSVRDAATCTERACWLWPHAYRKQRAAL